MRRLAVIICSLLITLATQAQDAAPLLAWVTAVGSNSDVLSGLIAWWKFDGNAVDSVGANNGTVTGAFLTDGVAGQAYYFRGVSDIIRTTADTRFNFDGSSPFSVCCWVRVTEKNKTQMIVARMTGAPAYRGWNVYVSAINMPSVVLRADNATSKFLQVNVTSNITHGAWVHLAATYTGNGRASGVAIYLGGETNAARSVVRDTLEGQSIQTTEPLVFGDLNSGGFPFAGAVDDVRIFNRVLTRTEIKAIIAEVQ